MMAEYEKKVREELKRNGWTFQRSGKGDHDIYYNPRSGLHPITVDHVIKSRHTANAIMKQAGINHKF